MSASLPLSRLATYVNGRPFKPEEKTPSGLPVIRIKQFLDPAADLDFFDGTVEPRHLLSDGDLVFSWSASLAVGLWDRGPSVLNQHLFNVHPAVGVDKRWLRWALDSSLSKFAGMMHGSAMTHITKEMLRDVVVAVPSLETQRRVADFLDDQVALLDRAIHLRQKQIELLGENLESFRERGLLLPEAVWTPVGSLLSQRISDGPHETPTWADQGIPFLSVDSVVDDELNFDGCRYISEIDHLRYAQKAAPQRGDVLVTKAASIGKVAVVRTDMTFNVWSPLAILRPRAGGVRSDFLAHCLRLRRVQSMLKLTSNTNTQANLSMSALSRTAIPLLELSAQVDAEAKINDQAETLRGAQLAVSYSMGLLKERKQALITAAVTGEFDVSTASARSVA